MDLVTVVMCNWKDDVLLRSSVRSLLRSFTVDASLKVVLNEPQKESIEFLSDHNIEFVVSRKNRGPIAVDLLNPLVDSPYIVTVNDDQLFQKGWLERLVEVAKTPACSASCQLVEPEDTGNPLVFPMDLGFVGDESTAEAFYQKAENERVFRREARIGYIHPKMVKTSDWMSVGGYGLWDYGFGVGGQAADDYFAYRLWEKYGGQFRFYALADGCAVYHQISHTAKKLPAHVRHHNAGGYFKSRVGMTTQEFRNEIGGWGSPINY